MDTAATAATAGTQQARLDRLRRAFPEVDDENLIETLEDAISSGVIEIPVYSDPQGFEIEQEADLHQAEHNNQIKEGDSGSDSETD